MFKFCKANPDTGCCLSGKAALECRAGGKSNSEEVGNAVSSMKELLGDAPREQQMGILKALLSVAIPSVGGASIADEEVEALIQAAEGDVGALLLGAVARAHLQAPWVFDPSLAIAAELEAMEGSGSQQRGGDFDDPAPVEGTSQKECAKAFVLPIAVAGALCLGLVIGAVINHLVARRQSYNDLPSDVLPPYSSGGQIAVLSRKNSRISHVSIESLPSYSLEAPNPEVARTTQRAWEEATTTSTTTSSSSA